MKMTLCTFAASMLLVAACQQLPTTSNQLIAETSLPFSPIINTEDTLNKMTVLDTPDSLIRYEVGNPNFRGQTTVEITGKGQVTVRFKQGQQNDEYNGQLSDADFVRLQETLRKNNPLSLVSSQTMGKPDEPRIRLTVITGGQEQTTELWNSEQWQIPVLRNLVTTFNQIATDVSDGKVRY